MGSFTDRISVYIDVVTDKAAAGLNNFKQQVGQAEGVTGKLGAAAKGAGDLLSSMPLPAVGAAVVGVGTALKGLGDSFTKSALEAKKMADATGLNVEKSSQWIAAADDVGISAEQIEGAFGKATKAIGMAPAKFEELGVSVVHAKDGTIDMNETLLNAVTTINAIQDPTKKAALASQLFGKSWADLTPLLDRGTTAIRATMDATSDAQTTTDGEVDSAKKWQATMDNLGDVFVDIQAILGKLVVQGLGPAIEKVSELAGRVDDLANKLDGGTGILGQAGDALGFWVGNLNPAAESVKVLEVAQTGFSAALDAGSDALGKNSNATDDAKKSSGSWGDEMLTQSETIEKFGRSLDSATSRVEDHTKAIDVTKQAEADYAEQVKRTNKTLEDEKKANDDARDALKLKQDAALGAIDSERGYHRAVEDVGTALGEFQQSAADAETATKKHGAASKEAAGAAKEMDDKSRGLEDAVSQAAAAAAQYAKDQAEAAGKTFTTSDKIEAQKKALDELKAKFPEIGPSIDAYKAKLDSIPKTITTNLVITTGRVPLTKGPVASSLIEGPGDPGTATNPFNIQNPMQTAGWSSERWLEYARLADAGRAFLENNPNAAADVPITGYPNGGGPNGTPMVPGLPGLTELTGTPHIVVNIDVQGSLVGANKADVGRWAAEGLNEYYRSGGTRV